MSTYSIFLLSSVVVFALCCIETFLSLREASDFKYINVRWFIRETIRYNGSKSYEILFKPFMFKHKYYQKFVKGVGSVRYHYEYDNYEEALADVKKLQQQEKDAKMSRKLKAKTISVQ